MDIDRKRRVPPFPLSIEDSVSAFIQLVCGSDLSEQCNNNNNKNIKGTECGTRQMISFSFSRFSTCTYHTCLSLLVPFFILQRYSLSPFAPSISGPTFLLRWLVSWCLERDFVVISFRVFPVHLFVSTPESSFHSPSPPPLTNHSHSFSR